MTEQAKFTYSPLEKAFEKEAGKQVDVIKSLDLSNKWKWTESILPQNVMNDLIGRKFKKMVELLQKDDLNYKSNRRKTYDFSKNSLPIILRDIHERYLQIEKADNKQWNFASKLKNFDKRYKSS